MLHGALVKRRDPPSSRSAPGVSTPQRRHHGPSPASVAGTGSTDRAAARASRATLLAFAACRDALRALIAGEVALRALFAGIFVAIFLRVAVLMWRRPLVVTALLCVMLLAAECRAKATYAGPAGNERVINVTTTMQCMESGPPSLAAAGGDAPACPAEMLRAVTMIIVDLYLEEDYQRERRLVAEGTCSGFSECAAGGASGAAAAMDAARVWQPRPLAAADAALRFSVRPNATGLLRRVGMHDSLHRMVSQARFAVACEPRAPVGLHLAAPLDGAEQITRCTVSVHRPAPPTPLSAAKKKPPPALAPVQLLVDNSAMETLFATDSPDIDTGAVVRAVVERDAARTASALAVEHRPPTVVVQLFERGAALGVQLIERPPENARFTAT